MTENNANVNNGKKDNRKGLIIGFIVFLLLLNGIQLYFRMQDKNRIEEKEAVVVQQEAEINMAARSIDSLRTELQTRYDEIAKLGGDTASIGQALRDLQVEYRRAQTSQRRSANELRQLKQDYGMLLTQKDEEIARLKEVNETLYQENRGLKTTIVAREDSLNQLRMVRNELAQKVEVASRLKVDNIRTTIIDNRGRERDDRDNEFRGRRIDRIKINFSIAENPVARIETKDVMLRVLEPEGATLHDASTGSGTFNAQGQEMLFTAKQSFLFDNRNPNLTFVYGKGTPFKKGQHIVELYVDGYKIGEDSFIVK